MTAAARFAGFAAGLTFDSLPPDVVARAKLQTLDTLGCGLAAVSRDEGTAARSWAIDEGVSSGGAALLGDDRWTSPASAALGNGMLCHALDFDDTHPASMCHISAVVVPVALALAQALGRPGRNLITAVVAGGETTARIGMAAPGAFHARGLHPTAACGVFGAAIAAGSLLELDADQITLALGIAGSTASGLFEYLSDGSATKPFHAGWAAHAGIVAAQLARYGATGPASVLEGRFGLYRALLGEDFSEALAEQVDDLGRRWETTAIAIKPYPACHLTHAAMDGARELLAQGLDPADIARIEVGLPADALPIVVEPVARKMRPDTAYEAKFSLQYSLAAMLAQGSVDLATYNDARLADASVTALAERVTCRAIPRETRGPFFATVTAVRADGSSRCIDVPHPEGTPERPLSATRVSEKFSGNAATVLGASRAQELADAVLELDTLTDVAALPLNPNDGA